MTCNICKLFGIRENEQSKYENSRGEKKKCIGRKSFVKCKYDARQKSPKKNVNKNDKKRCFVEFRGDRKGKGRLAKIIAVLKEKENNLYVTCCSHWKKIKNCCKLRKCEKIVL